MDGGEPLSKKIIKELLKDDPDLKDSLEKSDSWHDRIEAILIAILKELRKK